MCDIDRKTSGGEGDLTRRMNLPGGFEMFFEHSSTACLRRYTGHRALLNFDTCILVAMGGLGAADVVPTESLDAVAKFDMMLILIKFSFVTSPCHIIG